MLKKAKILLVSCLTLLFFAGVAVTILQAKGVGSKVTHLKVIDFNDLPRYIPPRGRKVVTIMYTDPDRKDVNDPLLNAIKAKKYPKATYQGVIIFNAKDTRLPHAVIRSKQARSKQAQFKDEVILLDTKHKVKNAWRLGNCNDAGVVIIIGKDKKIKFKRTIKTQAQSRAAIGVVKAILDEEIKK